jgi:hypothetical protein
MIQSRVSDDHHQQLNHVIDWAIVKDRKGKAHLERANYMLGGDSLLRVLLTDLVRLGRNEMYEF